MDVEITVPPSHLAQIQIRRNDSIAAAVQLFAKKYGLNLQTSQKVEQQITSHLKQQGKFGFTFEGREEELQENF